MILQRGRQDESIDKLNLEWVSNGKWLASLPLWSLLKALEENQETLKKILWFHIWKHHWQKVTRPDKQSGDIIMYIVMAQP